MNHIFVKIVSTLAFLISLFGILLWYSAVTQEKRIDVPDRAKSSLNPFLLRALPPQYNER